MHFDSNAPPTCQNEFLSAGTVKGLNRGGFLTVGFWETPT